nr:phage portal protein [Allomuricauda sp.]
MGLLTDSIGLLSQKRSAGSPSPFSSIFFGSSAVTPAGRRVTQSTSLKISAYYCALTTLADSYAMLPKAVYQKKDKNHNRVDSHPLNYLYTDEANQFMTPFMFDFMMVMACYHKGNAFAQIIRNDAGEVVQKIYLDPDHMVILKHNGKLFYKYRNIKTFSSEEIIHVPFFSTSDGIVGKPIIHYAAESMGTPMAAQEYGSNSYNDKGVTLGVLETEKVVKPEAKAALRTAWNNALTDSDPHRAVILDEGFQYKPIRLTPEQSQFIAAKVEGVADIARWFKMPLPMLHVKGEGGHSFLTQMRLQYLQDAFMPLSEKFMQEDNRKLLTPKERKDGMYIHHNYNKLLQVDPKTRSEFYKNLTMVKAITPDEIRVLEGLNPYESGGDKPLQMVNMMTDEQLKNKFSDG